MRLPSGSAVKLRMAAASGWSGVSAAASRQRARPVAAASRSAAGGRSWERERDDNALGIARGSAKGRGRLRASRQRVKRVTAPRQGWRHVARIALGVSAACVATLAVAAGFFLWLLSRGPISLDAVAPLVARALSLGNGLEVSIDHTLLSLGPRGHVEILARGVHFAQAGSGALTLPDLAIELSPRAALHGVLAPTRIVVNRPELRLERSADGRFQFAIGEPAGGTGEEWGQKFMGDLLRPPSGTGTLGYLTQLTVEGASLTVDDKALGVSWHAADASADVTRAADRAGAGSKLAGDFTYLPAYHQVVVRLGFDALNPASWAGAAPALAPLAAVDL